LQISGLSLAKGSADLQPMIELTYTTRFELPAMRGNAMGDAGLAPELADIDCNSDGIVSSIELSTFASDITSKAAEGNPLDATDIVDALAVAGFDTISKAKFSNPLSAFKSETAVYAGMLGDVKPLDLLLAGGGKPDEGGFYPWDLTSPDLQELPGGDGDPVERGLLYNVDLLMDEDVEGMGMGMGFVFEGISEDPMQGNLSDTIQDVWQNFQVQRRLLAQISEIQSEEGFRKLIDELEEMKQGGELPRYLVRCCVKMFDPASGDVWPGYEVLGVRRIRKRVNVKGKCKCKKYYRLECKKGRENSIRTGVFKGRLHIECQYMDMIDVVRAIVDRVER